MRGFRMGVRAPKQLWKGGSGSGGGGKSKGGGGGAAAAEAKPEDFIQEGALGINVGIPADIEAAINSGEFGEVAKLQLIGENNRYGKSASERAKALEDAQELAKAVNHLRNGLPDRPGPKITSQSDFDRAFESAFNRVVDSNPSIYKGNNRGSGDLVPIYKIRQELGNRVSRRAFDTYLLTRASSGNFSLKEGTVENARGRDPRILDSVTTRLGKLRTQVGRD